MRNQDVRLPTAAAHSGTAVFLEAEPGYERESVLDMWLTQARESGHRVIGCSGNVDEYGVWAGLRGVLEALLPRIRATAPRLIQQHSYELCLVLPELRRELAVVNPCLTDVASDDEKVRNYPNDRAYRSLHGLIDLLDAWSDIDGDRGWAIACDDFDRATTLTQRFFAELIRRRGDKLQIALLLAVAPGTTGPAMELFEPRSVKSTIRVALPASARATPLPAVARERAMALEREIGEDRIAWSMHVPELLGWWRRSDLPERAIPWLVRAVNVYDHDGLYEIALRYVPAVEASFDWLYDNDRHLHGFAVLNVFFCYAALNRADDALRILETEGLPRVEDPAFLTEIHYFLAMLHARFLAQRDQERAEQHLDRALECVAEQDVSAAQRHFLTVFVRNGLAYVRLKQGRVDDALELCRAGLWELEAYLAPAEHRLHRSVLLYNAAQVLSGLDRREEAIAHLTSAMEMDPNYSEYYLERGGLHLRSEQYAAAERDLLRAIELSPPYAEVWTDLGQCYRASGRMADAARAYSRALDLDPKVQLALIGRAEASVELGHLERAVADYSAALALEPDQPMVLAGRAVAHFEGQCVLDAVRDLDRAIGLAPEMPELYQNRAIALVELGRTEEARRDLRAYLHMAPDAADRVEVERQVAALA